MVIRGGTVIDGTGAEPFEADVAIDAGRIVAIGYAVLNVDDDGDVSAGTNAVWADRAETSALPA